MKKRQSGITLLELIIVLVLIAGISGILIGGLGRQADKAKSNAAKVHIEQIGQGLELYKLDIGRYPTTAEGLQALITAPAGVSNWNGPYGKERTLPLDPWKNEYRYQSPGVKGPYDITSFGADGKEGGEGENKDVTNG